MRLRFLLKAGVIASTVCVAYVRLIRPRVLNWGATADEIERAMPGDDVLPAASLQTTRAITVGAPPEHVWPWLVQMGPKPRAGAYTYDWVERMLGIDIKNADRVLPEYQQLEPGTFMGIDEKGNGIKVLEVQSERALVLQWVPAKSTWTFGLYPRADGTCRLVSRNRLAGSGLFFWLLMVALMEPGSLIMEAKMLSGIKRRAEGLARVYNDPSAVAGSGQ